ncbi:hypothetical protein E4U11_000530 [Claviceps purpurea]|nr:hypothetical protein E4U11_000530 [Claviceps purpurea]
MPPHVPRKRLRSPADKEGLTAQSRQQNINPKRKREQKPGPHGYLDATTTPVPGTTFNSVLQNLDCSDDSSDSLTSLSDADFEDVPLAKRQRVSKASPDNDDDDGDSDGDESIEFEDVAAPETDSVPVVSGDLELTLNKDTRLTLTNVYGDRKGPSKRERKVRNATHCMHVLLLLWHNAVRNSWICDAQVQATMISHLPSKMWEEVERWRLNSGLVTQPPTEAAKRSETKSKNGAKGKKNARKSRHWDEAAKKLEQGAVDMSHGDPLFRLMQSLTAWWKQRYKITAPGLRKWGYMSLERLDKLTKAYKEEFTDQDRFGERTASLKDFQHCACVCEGSRDVGAQLFTALLRGLGIEARMVASLQPLGFGWSKLEDADMEMNKLEESANNTAAKKVQSLPNATSPKKKNKPQGTAATSKPEPKRKLRRRPEQANASLSDAEDNLKTEYPDSDDDSIISVDLTTPKKGAPKVRKYDTDLGYPHYWTEVLSPVTKKYLPVDPIVKNIVATNRELVESFEPRGQKADKARQVISYVVGYSSDGTAKDVTIRYLKRQVTPGRTKGVRMPMEKTPVYNRNGKVKRYEEFDWFRAAMSGYRRGSRAHPITEIDEEEDSTDLKPAKLEKKTVKEGEETLQYYKDSKEFVLERHLKREEAFKAQAKPVKKFKNKAKRSKGAAGAAAGGGEEEEEDVFLRSDVVQVKSAETWHKQGRAPLAGERPLKRVPYRAATLNRKREILEAEAATGEKVLQGLYSYEQTDWIIPPPIENGVIPKNEYGNIDLFAEHMCPQGAVYIPFRGVVKVCKRLQIDYAEAVVGFEFGHRMAVPVIQGVVIAEEHHDEVMVELDKDEAERTRKEDEKRRKAARGKWRRFIMGLRIVERIRQDYGEIDESVSVFGHSKAVGPTSAAPAADQEEEMAGGFLPEGYEEEGEAEQNHASSFFPVGDEDGEGEEDDAGLTIEHDQ